MLDPHGSRHGACARPADPHRDRPPTRPRVGRVGREGPSSKRRFLRAARPVLPVRGPGHFGGSGRGGWGDLPPRAPPGGPVAVFAPPAVAGARGGRGRDLAVVRRVAPFLLWTGAPLARAMARAGALPPPDEHHVVRRPSLRETRLGRARGHRRIQRPGRAAPPDGGEGWAARAHPPLPVRGGAGRRAGGR